MARSTQHARLDPRAHPSAGANRGRRPGDDDLDLRDLSNVFAMVGLALSNDALDAIMKVGDESGDGVCPAHPRKRTPPARSQNPVAPAPKRFSRGRWQGGSTARSSGTWFAASGTAVPCPPAIRAFRRHFQGRVIVWSFFRRCCPISTG